MKVISMDKLNRDYQPETLVTVSLSEYQANFIADNLNKLNDGRYYDVKADSYILHTESVYDIADVEKPTKFEFNLYGLNAIPNIKELIGII
jgi:hypothetical protein